MDDNRADLGPMVLFAAVVEAGSFAGAARALGLTRSAVHKQVVALEERHGVRLLRRTTRRLELTEVGAEFHTRCVQLHTLARDAIADLSEWRAEPRGTLRVSAPLGLGDAFLAPALAEFLALYPQLEANVQLDDTIVDLIEAGIDVGVRAGRMPDSALRSRRLGSVELVICAASDLGASVPTPDALTATEWITYSPLGAQPKLHLQRGEEQIVVRPSGRLTANHGGVIRTFLRAGLGVSLLPRFFVADDLAAGRLVQLLPDWQMPSAPIYAVWPPGRFLPLKVRRFVDFMVARGESAAS